MSKSQSEDSRTAKAVMPRARASREAVSVEERPEGGVSDDAFRDMVRNEFVQEALPQIPDTDKWHFCWLSTTSSHDPIHKRIRMGYQAARFEDVSSLGLDDYRVSQGEYSGGIGCNEMVLFKIAKSRHRMMMEEFHHNMPHEEEATIKRQLNRTEEDRDGKPLFGVDSKEDEGFTRLGEDRRPPVFN